MRGCAGRMEEFQTGEEVTGWGQAEHSFSPGVSFQNQWKVSGGVRPPRVPPLGVPRRHPCGFPRGGAACLRHRRHTGPAFVLPPREPAPCPGVHWAPRLWLQPLPLQSLGEKARGMSWPCGPAGGPSAGVGGWPGLFGAGQNPSKLFLCGKECKPLVCVLRAHGWGVTPHSQDTEWDKSRVSVYHRAK